MDSTHRQSLFFLSIGFALLLAYVLTRSYHFGTFGTNDFIEYWSAFRITQDGGNPYSPAEMLQVQRTLNPQAKVPLMMWNPPWLLVLLAPVLSLEFETSARLFAALSVTAWFLSAVLLLHCFENPGRKGSVLFVLAAGCFLPAWMTLKLGQISLFLLLAVSTLFWGWKTGRLLAAGAAFSVCTLKPHLVYLPALLFLWWSIRSRRLEGIAAALVCSVVLVASARLLMPDVFLAWREVVAGRALTGATHPKSWQVATLVGIVRLQLMDRGMQPLWPMAVIPGVMAVGLMFLLLRVRRSFPLERFLPPLLAASVLTSPYGWLFDHSLVLPLQVFIAFEAMSLPRLRMALVGSTIAAVNIFGMLLWGNVIRYHHQFWWYPLAVLVLFFVSGLLKRQMPE